MLQHLLHLELGLHLLEQHQYNISLLVAAEVAAVRFIIARVVQVLVLVHLGQHQDFQLLQVSLTQ
jgi:hypothetical protein